MRFVRCLLREARRILLSLFGVLACSVGMFLIVYLGGKYGGVAPKGLPSHPGGTPVPAWLLLGGVGALTLALIVLGALKDYRAGGGLSRAQEEQRRQVAAEDVRRAAAEEVEAERWVAEQVRSDADRSG